MSKEYAIVVAQKVPTRKLRDPNDRVVNPRGAYMVRARSGDGAIGRFEKDVPIGCADDYDITCIQISPG